MGIYYYYFFIFWWDYWLAIFFFFYVIIFCFFSEREVRRRRQQARNASIEEKVARMKEKKEVAERWQQRKRLFLQPLTVGVIAVGIVGGIWMLRVWWGGSGGEMWGRGWGGSGGEMWGRGWGGSGGEMLRVWWGGSGGEMWGRWWGGSGGEMWGRWWGGSGGEMWGRGWGGAKEGGGGVENMVGERRDVVVNQSLVCNLGQLKSCIVCLNYIQNNFVETSGVILIAALTVVIILLDGREFLNCVRYNWSHC